MAGKSGGSKGKRVSVDKSELAEGAVEAETLGIMAEEEGAVEVAEGVETLEAAGEVEAVAGAALAAGASDLTRAVDLEVVAERSEELSDDAEALAEAGVLEIEEADEASELDRDRKIVE